MFAYSTVTPSFSQARAAAVIVQPDPRVVIDMTGAGPLTQPARIAGWAVDFAADGATGIDAVDVWAYPADGAAPRVVGWASYGHARPTSPRPTANLISINSGYTLSLTGIAAGQDLAPGTCRVVAFAHSTVSGLVDQSRVRTVTVSAIDPR